MTRVWGGTTNPTTLIFIVDTSIFGLLCLVGFGSDPFAAASTTHGIVSVLFGGIAVGMAYAAWMLGMSRGNMAVLAAVSYFTPVLSCVFATFWIEAKLDSGFWSGVALVGRRVASLQGCHRARNVRPEVAPEVGRTVLLGACGTHPASGKVNDCH